MCQTRRPISVRYLTVASNIGTDLVVAWARRAGGPNRMRCREICGILAQEPSLPTDFIKPFFFCHSPKFMEESNNVCFARRHWIIPPPVKTWSGQRRAMYSATNCRQQALPGRLWGPTSVPITVGPAPTDIGTAIGVRSPHRYRYRYTP